MSTREERELEAEMEGKGAVSVVMTHINPVCPISSKFLYM